MSSESKSATLTDWLMIAISPLLIMMMVGSFAFFLIEVFYLGQYSGRMSYTMFFFVFAIVLIARISIEEGYRKAAGYAALLGAATLFALDAYGDYPPGILKTLSPLINLLILVMIWWTSNKLTWDCTHFDETRRASGRGVLAAVGLDPTTNPRPNVDDPELELQVQPKKTAKPEEGLLGWFSRWNKHSDDQNRKPHTAGTWVLYLSLAAIPIFGLGQALIPASDTARRRATLMQMTVFVGSALALLATTSLLGLRKYLRERNARIPNSMTYGWLGIGALLIVIFVGVSMVLPRPNSETALVDFSRQKTKSRDASKFAQVNDSDAGKGEGTQGTKTENDPGAKQTQKNPDAKQPGPKDPNAKQQSGDGKEQSKNSGNQNSDSKDQSQKGDKSQNKDGSEPSKDKQQNSKQKEQSQQKKDAQKDEQSKEKNNEKQQDDADRKQENKSERTEPRASQMLEAIGNFLKWLVWIAIAIAVIAGVIYFILNYLSEFTTWAKNLLDWLKNLFKRKSPSESASDDDPVRPEVGKVILPSFADFSNPFRDGRAKALPVGQVIEYSFHALNGWACDQECGRKPGETPHEFVARLKELYPDLAELVEPLANNYSQAAFSQKPLPEVALSNARRLWKLLETYDHSSVDTRAGVE